ncbi:hypothetical protein [Sinobacterium caligoides]|uniref:hypothetical protein n=1 Tax=Sinobacterium caligoides TaxID=933926 RepID=UPI0011CD7955|nr:hypothetical protein [Sinobacterium caligoides]
MKLAIITGGSKGLGKALVEQYVLTEDWHVVELSRSGVSKCHINCDLSDVKSITSLSNSLFLKLAGNEWDEVVYINNAGDLKPISSISNLNPVEIERNISINLI